MSNSKLYCFTCRRCDSFINENAPILSRGKFIPSKAALEFALKYKNAFILLLIIAERARRTNGDPDGLTIGQCHLGNHKSYEMTEKEYRYAKQILIEQGLIKIILTNRTRKKCKRRIFLNSENSENGATERATEITTTGTLVELCNSDVWDINSEDTNQSKGDRKGDLGATEGRLKGDKQERRRKKKNEEEEELPHTPSVSKIKFRELVELTQDQHDSLLAKHGPELLKLMLDKLDSYKGSNKKKYDSDFHTMKEGGWVVNQVKKDLETQKSKSTGSNTDRLTKDINGIPVENQYEGRF